MNALRGSEVVLGQIKASIRGQTRPGINGQISKSLVIPVPTQSEQKVVLKTIKGQFTRIRELKTLLSDLYLLHDRLDQSILAKAFRGELVPQDLMASSNTA